VGLCELCLNQSRVVVGRCGDRRNSLGDGLGLSLVFGQASSHRLLGTCPSLDVGLLQRHGRASCLGASGSGGRRASHVSDVNECFVNWWLERKNSRTRRLQVKSQQWEKKMPFGQSRAVVNSVNSDERGWEVGFKDRNMQAERLRDCCCRAV
jgi:hypothetical protein